MSGEGSPLIILHGLFGSLDNWATLGRHWANDYTVYMVDLRNHGKSPHTDTHTIPDMAGDMIDFIRKNQIDSPVVMGHSMGGKVAMEVALQIPDEIRALIIADIGAHSYPRGHDYIFQAIHSLDLQKVQSRKQIEKKLSESINNIEEVFFMSKNIDRTKDGFKWKINTSTLEKDYEEILKPIEAGRIFDKATLLLKGEKSKYVKKEHIDQLKLLFPRIRVETIPDSGHWLHADQPDIFKKEVGKFMEEL